jgi:hypothetical protein
MNSTLDLETPAKYKLSSGLKLGVLGCLGVLVVAALLLIQGQLDARQDTAALHIEELRVLPRGEYLKPVLLGYHHFAADLLWLRTLQTIGQRSVTSLEYEWLYHALDVITTLDPRYDYAYQAGGIILTEFAERVDLSNRLYIKGMEANPTVWQLPFYLGYNHFFYLHDDAKAGEYMLRASGLPGRPHFLPFLATRLAAAGGSPEVALDFLGEMLRQTEDVQIKEQIELRIKELIIERDLRMLEDAVQRYTQFAGKPPVNLQQLLTAGLLTAIPGEPFGGEYRYDAKTGGISSSTHTERLRIKKRGHLPQSTPPPALPEGTARR